MSRFDDTFNRREVGKPHLIQRVKMRWGVKPGDVGTVDHIFEMDYMGAAEFEFGALPASLKRVCCEINEFHLYEMPDVRHFFTKKRLIVFALPPIWTEYKQYIPGLMREEIRLHESTYLKELTTGKSGLGREVSEYYQCVVLWWDIQNDLFFCFGNEIMKRWQSCLFRTIEKKKAEGKTDWLPSTECTHA